MIASLLSGCGDNYSWRQKITLTIKAPSGEVSGYSVSEVSWRKNFWYKFFGPTYNGSARGEAVAVDLGGGRNLLLLLSNDRHFEYIEYIFPTIVRGADFVFVNRDIISHAKRSKLNAPLSIPEKFLPALVTFMDASDPKSIRYLNPSDIEKVFGAGYAIKSATIESTIDAVTAGRVAGLLPWLRTFKGGNLLGENGTRMGTDASRTSIGSFVMGEPK